MAAKVVDIPRCAKPHVPGPDRGGTAAIGSSHGRHLFSGCPGCEFWQGCHSLFCSGMLYTRLAAQQTQKRGRFCSLNRLGTQACWLGLRGQLREAGTLPCCPNHITLFHREQMHPTANNLQDSCVSWGLLKGCGDAGCGTSTPRVMLGCRCGEADLHRSSCPNGCERQPLC